MTTTFILYLISLGFFLFLLVTNKKGIGNAVKGGDGRLDLIDVVKLVWLLLFTLGFLSCLYLGLIIQEAVWYSLDVVFLVLVANDGGKSYIAYLNKGKNENSSNPNTNSDPSELS